MSKAKKRVHSQTTAVVSVPAAAAQKTFVTRMDIPAATRSKLIKLLNQQLADSFDLYSQIKQAHWMVKGKRFIALHEFFDRLAGEALVYVDDIAERITALGGAAMGTARATAASSRLPEYPLTRTDDTATLDALAERFSLLAKSTRAAIDTADEIGDADTADLFTGISRALDKSLWFIEAHLQ